MAAGRTAALAHDKRRDQHRGSIDESVDHAKLGFHRGVRSGNFRLDAVVVCVQLCREGSQECLTLLARCLLGTQEPPLVIANSCRCGAPS